MYICKTPKCLHQTFYEEYTYNACKPDVKSDIHRQTVNGSSITAISHDTGKAVAFWFGTREHGNLDKLLALLSPLNISKVYTDGNYAYY